MTVRELIEKLSRMTANMQEMEVYTYTQDGYVPLQDSPYPILELGTLQGEQYCVVSGRCYATNPHQIDEARPSPAQLQNRIKVINL